MSYIFDNYGELICEYCAKNILQLSPGTTCEGLYCQEAFVDWQTFDKKGVVIMRYEKLKRIYES